MSKIENIKKIKKLLTILETHYIITIASRGGRQKMNIAGCGSAWLERLVWDQEVAGSNPVTPITRV